MHSQRLNCKVVPLADVPMKDQRPSGEGPGEDRQPAILVVHGEELVADCMALLLSRAGFKTQVAYDGRSALEAAFELQPDLMVSDIGIRNMDGVRLAMAIVEAMPRCKILLFSGHETHEDVASARARGYEFTSLIKPVHPAEMLKRVHECFADQGMTIVQ